VGDVGGHLAALAAGQVQIAAHLVEGDGQFADFIFGVDVYL
jgi:hypothetical protein